MCPSRLDRSIFCRSIATSIPLHRTPKRAPSDRTPIRRPPSAMPAIRTRASQSSKSILLMPKRHQLRIPARTQRLHDVAFMPTGDPPSTFAFDAPHAVSTSQVPGAPVRAHGMHDATLLTLLTPMTVAGLPAPPTAQTYTSDIHEARTTLPHRDLSPSRAPRPSSQPNSRTAGPNSASRGTTYSSAQRHATGPFQTKASSKKLSQPQPSGDGALARE